MPTFDQGIPMKHKPDQMVPRPLVIAMFTLMICSLGLVGYAQLTERTNVGVLIEAPVVQERSVILSGDRNGAYTVFDLDGNVIAASSDEKAGFIGVIGLTFKRERFTQGVTENGPVRVVRRENGNIGIIDNSTGLVVELIGYGVDNVAAFANLLD